MKGFIENSMLSRTPFGTHSTWRSSLSAGSMLLTCNSLENLLRMALSLRTLDVGLLQHILQDAFQRPVFHVARKHTRPDIRAKAQNNHENEHSARR